MDRMRLIDRPEGHFLYVNCAPSLKRDVAQFINHLKEITQTHQMRELNVTQSILSKALLKAREANKRIKSLQLAIGEISELDQNSIQEHWNELSQGTVAERAQLHFRFIKAEVQCMACFSKYYPVDGKIHCPYCGSYGAKILSGEEFFLESIELDG